MWIEFWFDYNDNDKKDNKIAKSNEKNEIQKPETLESLAENLWVTNDSIQSFTEDLKQQYNLQDTWYETILNLIKTKDISIFKSLLNAVPFFNDMNVDNTYELDDNSAKQALKSSLLIYHLKTKYPKSSEYIQIICYWILATDSNFFKWAKNVEFFNSLGNIAARYWDKFDDYLAFCWKWISKTIDNSNFLSVNEWWRSPDETKYRMEWFWMISTFVELFNTEPESRNLFEFLSDNPQKLSNLWWKHIKEIPLTIDNWVNFCFRWILEMVKSRNDLNIPHLSNSPTQEQKQERKKWWEYIIKEYENILREYISNDFVKDEKWNVAEDKNWESLQKPRNTTFDKIFFSQARGEEDPTWVMKLASKDFDISDLQKYSNNPIEDISSDVTKNNSVDYIKQYLEEHPNEHVLIFLDQHGSDDWSSSNWRNKEDWLKLANISSNLKIMSSRCNFWYAYDNETFYEHKSSLSWFSNKESAVSTATQFLRKWYEKWMWFYETELRIRLQYNLTVSPLSETMSYVNKNNNKTEIWKVWLAQVKTADDLLNEIYAIT